MSMLKQPREFMKEAPDSRIGLFMPSLGGGGAERVMLTLAGEMALRGHPVDLVVARAEGPLRDQIPEDVRLVDLGRSRVITCLPRLVRYLRSERPTGLLSTLCHANVVALWAKELSGIPIRVVVREANTPSTSLAHARLRRSRLLEPITRLTYPRAAGVVAVSEGVADDLILTSGLERKDIRVIYNPVLASDLYRRAAEAIDHPWFEPGASPVILGAGRLTHAKDFPTLIRAFALLRKKREVRLVILGEGRERQALSELPRDLGVASDVDLPGFISNPFPYMRQAAVFVLSSVYEGLPNVLIQALGLSRPVVATDCPSGPREILQDGKLGELVPVGDPEAMAAAVERALDTPRPRPEAEDLARFQSDVVTRSYIELILGGRSHG